MCLPLQPIQHSGTTGEAEFTSLKKIELEFLLFLYVAALVSVLKGLN